MTFNSNVLMNLCPRNYGLRLTKGRRQMHLPPDLLQAFVDNALFFQWFNPHCETSEAAWMDEFLDDMEELDDYKKTPGPARKPDTRPARKPVTTNQLAANCS